LFQFVSLLIAHRQVELRFVLVLFGFCHSHVNRASDLKRTGGPEVQ